MFLDKYLVCTLELEKSKVAQKDTNEVVAYFQEKINNHPKATFIASFDQYAHTKK